MKIAIISGTFFPFPGGAQVEVHNLANKFVEKGHKVDVYIYRNTNIKNNKYNLVKINFFFLNILYLLKYFFNFNIDFLFKYMSLIKKEYEVYHFQFITFKSLILINYLIYHKKKVIITPQGADIQIKKNINYGFRLNKKFNNYFLKTIIKVVYFQSISKNIYKDLSKIIKKDSKIQIIPNSICLDKFKKKSGINKNKKVINILTVARYAKLKKGFDLIPKIAKELIKRNIDFSWKIIGENSNKIYDDEFIKKKSKIILAIPNIKNYKEYYHPSSNLIKFYKDSDVYLNLARIESFGITFIESLAAKLPVLTFNNKGANEIIINKYNGFVVKNRNVKKMANIIERIYKKKISLKDIKNNAFKSVKKYNIDQSTNKLISFYKKIISN